MLPTVQETRKIMSESFHIQIQSSLAKILPAWKTEDFAKDTVLTMLQEDRVSFQAAFQGSNVVRETVSIAVTAPDTLTLRVRTVELVPAAYPCRPWYDDGYYTHIPGLYPDLLREPEQKDGLILADAVPGQWRSIWIDVMSSAQTPPGDYTVSLRFLAQDGSVLGCAEKGITVCEGILPGQTLLHTEWFHTDCLADYYSVTPWSEEHWNIVEQFLAVYGKHGMNTILTPLFTPPLDTEWGGERTTVQLVDVSVTSSGYTFGFEKLRRWVSLCQKHGISRFEFSHLFTQWGAAFAPKIMVWENGTYKRRFGWDTPAAGEDYASFLHAFLPALKEEIFRLHLEHHVFFHLSDEPGADQIHSYEQARQIAAADLEGFPSIDALSDYSFYEKGYVSRPVVAANAAEPFLRKNVSHLWVYYCSAQDTKVSNRFIAMYSQRNRILGVQLYKFQIEGFLHWGFNFYNDMLSRHHINPYLVTDCGCAFPSGDGFLVYPGPNGIPEESIRLMVLEEGFQDTRALQLLEQLTSREHVLALLEEGLPEELTFSCYPKEDCWILELRNRVNREIMNKLHGICS